MKKLLTILFFFIISFAQSQDYRQIDWKFKVSDVVLINTDTFQINAIPTDFNDKGAIDRVVGNYVIDFVARCFKVIDSTSTTLTVVDLAHENIAPQTNQVARCYRSVLNGASLFSSIGGVDISVIDELSRWKDVARNNELFARAIDSLALTVTDIKTANYTAGINEFIRCNVVGGGFTVTLPDAPTDRTLVVIQSINIVSSANILEITTSGTDVLAIPGGPTSIYIGLALETVSMQYDTSGVWVLEHTAPPSNFATNFPGIDAQTPIPSSAITINYTTRVLTVTPPLGYFQFNVDGNGKSTRFRKDTNIDFPAFDDVSGIWYFYFDETGTSITTSTPWNNFNTIAAVYRLLWNATLSGSAKSIVENIETHENTISGDDHAWKHKYGAINFSGFDCFNNALPSGSPVAGGSETVVSFNSGMNIDDNLSYTIENSTGGLDWQQDLGELNPASLDATNSALMTIKYRDAANLLYVLPATRFPFAWDTGTNRPEYITTTGVRTLVSNLNYFVYYVYSIQDPRTGEGLSLVSATSEFGTITDAQAHSWGNIQSNYPNTNDGEVRPLYKYIFQYRSNYGVTNKYSVLREVTDIRKQEVTQGTTIAGSIAASQVTLVPTVTGETNAQSGIDGNALDISDLQDTAAVHLGRIETNEDDISTLQSSSHPELTIDGSYDYATLDVPTQVLTLNQVDYDTDIDNTPTTLPTSSTWQDVIDNGTATVTDNIFANNFKVTETQQIAVVGTSILSANTTGNNLSGLGYGALLLNTEGRDNVAVGTLALRNNTTGAGLTAIGNQALYSNTTAFYNVAIGDASLQNTTGQNNTSLGSYSGNSNTTGENNIFLGYRAGFNQTINDNLLIIDNQDRTSTALELSNSLIYGVFDSDPLNQTIRINGKLGINRNPDSVYELDITGEGRFSGSLNASSFNIVNANWGFQLSSSNLRMKSFDGWQFYSTNTSSTVASINSTGVGQLAQGTLDADVANLGDIRGGTENIDGLTVSINGEEISNANPTLDEVTVNGNSLSSGYLNYFNGTNIAPSPAFTDGTNIGIETDDPNALLDMYNGSFAIEGATWNDATRPAIGSGYVGLIDGEIWAHSAIYPAHIAGLLRLSAGGNDASTFAKSWIDISGQSNVADLNNNIVFGTASTEKMRISSDGEVTIHNGATVADAPVIGIDIFRLDDATNGTINMDGLTISYNGDDLLQIISDSIAGAGGTDFNYTTQNLTETSGAVTWDTDDGIHAAVTIDETTVITLSNVIDGQTGNIAITQGDSGDDNVTFVHAGLTVKWRGNDTDLTNLSGAIDVISYWRGGSILYVTLGSNYTTQ